MESFEQILPHHAISAILTDNIFRTNQLGRRSSITLKIGRDLYGFNHNQSNTRKEAKLMSLMKMVKDWVELKEEQDIFPLNLGFAFL